MTQVTIANVTTNVLTYKDQRVITTKQLADFYGCEETAIRNNLSRNKEYFSEGKHFHRLTGQQVADFSSLYLLDIRGSTNTYTLWTEKGAARHAKMLTTEKAWEVFEELEDTYFQVKESSKIPQTYSEALRLAADLVEQVALATEERDKAIATKALIGSKREATAMASASAATRKANKLEVELDQSKQYATVKRMEGAYKRKFNWRTLKAISAELNLPSLDVFDANYCSVKSYHAEVWRKAYEISPAAIATESLLS